MTFKKPVYVKENLDLSKLSLFSQTCTSLSRSQSTVSVENSYK